MRYLSINIGKCLVEAGIIVRYVVSKTSKLYTPKIMISKKTVLFIVVMAALSYRFYTPMPEKAKEPWKQRMTLASIKLITDLSNFGDYIGLGSWVNITRILTENIKYMHTSQSSTKKLQVYDDVFDGVKVRIYRPVGINKPMPGIVHIHGGGWSLMSVDAYDAFTRELAEKSDAVVISIEYRLSPEYPYPVPLEDCVTATKYFLNHADKLGADAKRTAVIGDSAGGNLAMAVSIKISEDSSVPNLKVQSLLYPALQAFDFNTPSYQQFTTARRDCPSFVTKESLIVYWQLYGFGKLQYSYDFSTNNHTSMELKKSEFAKYMKHSNLPKKHFGDAYNGDFDSTSNDVVARQVESLITNPYFAPLMASDEQLKKQPNTYIITAEYDAARDDAWLLINRLKTLKHPHQYDHFEGLEHGFGLMMHYEAYPKFIRNLINFFKKNL